MHGRLFQNEFQVTIKRSNNIYNKELTNLNEVIWTICPRSNTETEKHEKNLHKSHIYNS